MKYTYSRMIYPLEYMLKKGMHVLLLNEAYLVREKAIVTHVTDREFTVECNQFDGIIYHVIPKGQSAHILYDKNPQEQIYAYPTKKLHKKKVSVCIAGGGIAGSALFRYFSEMGYKPIMVNQGNGMTWHSIAGGRTHFSLPELSDIARHNQEIYRNNQQLMDLGFRDIKYYTFAHNEHIMQALENSAAWDDKLTLYSLQDAHTIISPFISDTLAQNYLGIMQANNCWQVLPGRVVTLLRKIGLSLGGEIYNHTRVNAIEKEASGQYRVHIVYMHDNSADEIICDHFVNAMGTGAAHFAKKQGLADVLLYPEKHFAFITEALRPLGNHDSSLPMIITREQSEYFSAFYMQQYTVGMQLIGCVSPRTDIGHMPTYKEFIAYVSQLIGNWFPCLSPLKLETVWQGAYVEPRMYIDPEHGLFTGLKGHGLMLSQYLAQLYVRSLTGLEVPEYFSRLAITGDGLVEQVFA